MEAELTIYEKVSIFVKMFVLLEGEQMNNELVSLRKGELIFCLFSAPDLAQVVNTFKFRSYTNSHQILII